ncbi:MAG: hypothetical protein M0C28_00095 [Candidatus Moduliflexus flocculans]|nr:hypothetical protein [Candidatus Moduliflexus flocculans]
MNMSDISFMGEDYREWDAEAKRTRRHHLRGRGRGPRGLQRPDRLRLLASWTAWRT